MLMYSILVDEHICSRDDFRVVDGLVYADFTRNIVHTGRITHIDVCVCVRELEAELYCAVDVVVNS